MIHTTAARMINYQAMGIIQPAQAEAVSFSQAVFMARPPNRLSLIVRVWRVLYA